MKRLKQYMEVARLNGQEMAEIIGVHPSTISRILKKKLTPDLDLAFKIQHATDGYVPVTYWLDKNTPGATK